MIACVSSFVLQGIAATPCDVEVDLDETGVSRQTIVGLPDAAVREAMERVHAAIGNTGYRLPPARLLVNLAPADVRKEGPVYDLPIALGLLATTRTIRPPRPGRSGEQRLRLDDALVAGELALDGGVRPVRGVIAMATLARERHRRSVIVPEANAAEAAVVEGVDVYGVRTLADVAALLNGDGDPPRPHPTIDVASLVRDVRAPVDFAEIRGQEPVKRAITIAAAGGHNLLMLGPAGTGKTMMARALPGILPPLRAAEALEVTRIYSAVGRLAGGEGAGGLICRRPVRAPHHTASASAVIGGGAIPKPGEISLAHHGILFLDELPEFPRAVLDTLRQPLEEGSVTIARAHSAVRFPARFLLVAAMNPTPSGDAPADAGGRRAMQRYLGRISGPLIDRVDIHVEAPAVPWAELSGAAEGTGTAAMRARVEGARDRQTARQGATLNGQLSGPRLDEIAPLDEAASALVGQAITELGLSARGYDKIRRVARTIADLDESATGVSATHVAEAIQYRLLDRRGALAH